MITIIAELKEELRLLNQSYVELARAYTDLQISSEKRISELEELAEMQDEYELKTLEFNMEMER